MWFMCTEQSPMCTCTLCVQNGALYVVYVYGMEPYMHFMFTEWSPICKFMDFMSTEWSII